MAPNPAFHRVAGARQLAVVFLAPPLLLIFPTAALSSAATLSVSQSRIRREEPLTNHASSPVPIVTSVHSRPPFRGRNSTPLGRLAQPALDRADATAGQTTITTLYDDMHAFRAAQQWCVSVSRVHKNIGQGMDANTATRKVVSCTCPIQYPHPFGGSQNNDRNG